MKSKFILITILFSLFLTIGHDFIIYEKSKDNCLTTIQQVDPIQQSEDNIEDSCCNQVADLHNNFHFLGILTSDKTLLLLTVDNPLRRKQLSSTEIDTHTFKPPRA